MNDLISGVLLIEAEADRAIERAHAEAATIAQAIPGQVQAIQNQLAESFDEALRQYRLDAEKKFQSRLAEAESAFAESSQFISRINAAAIQRQAESVAQHYREH